MENALFTPWYTFFIFFAFVRVYFASLAFSSKEYYGHVASDPSGTGGGQRGIKALLGRTQLIPVLLIDRYWPLTAMI